MNTVIHKLTSWLGGHSLSCEEVNQFILDYLEGHLSRETARLFEKHVALCPNCGTYVAQYQATIAMIREQGEAPPDPPEELVEATLTFLQQHLNGHTS